MAETQTLARPYAEAVFEVAEANGTRAEWSNALAALAAIVVDDDVAVLMGNPNIDDTQLAEAVIAVGGADLHAGAKNLVRLLIDNRRLGLAPAIADQFESLRADVENRVDVHVTSAVALSDEQQNALAQSLEKCLDRNVRLTFDQDEDVIGGAVIRAGDLVIDGSLRAKLERMRQTLAQ